MLNANLYLACRIVPFVEKTVEETKVGNDLCLWAHTEAMRAFHSRGRQSPQCSWGASPMLSDVPGELVLVKCGEFFRGQVGLHLLLGLRLL